ncbi:type II secretion system F family protein [Metabacillus iocasae]|uniref:Type IV pilus assembly protein PilC n=1 Tax=Priestia iocasae TaxID=2291674 RepID=A0ABS2QPH4_9BACI|nr:type II secretion system F family protein [Metabacillus iocasae]MBM7701355.1 type IV pilus assembly protein PilC [Metabacillus iocasae]
MAQFQFEGKDVAGRKKRGKITSASKREAALQLKEKGIRVSDLQEVKETILNKEITIGSSVKLHDFVIYLRQFSTLLKAGVTVVDSTRILASQTESKALKKALFDVEDHLRGGNNLSTSCAKHKKVFPPMFVNMVKAGEVSGNLDSTLERLADHFEKQHRTRQKVISALAYPAAVGVVAIAVVIFLLVSVVPTFVDMFADFGADLPAITKFVLASSEFMQAFWWVIVGLILLVIVAFSFLYKQKSTRYYIDYALLRVPIFGGMLQKAAIARMTRTLSSLFSSSVPILQAIQIVEGVVDNEVISKVLVKSRDSLEKGSSLTTPMERHWVFPPLVTRMIAIGEETGSLDVMLGKVADFYEAEVETTTDRLKSLIEPLMIVILAGLVGTIVTSILIPMFDIFNHVQSY